MSFKIVSLRKYAFFNTHFYIARPLLFVLCLAMQTSLLGCGGSVSQAENAPQASDQLNTNEPIPTPPSGVALSGDELNQLPKVEVGARQFADANVMVTLDGTVEAAAGAEIVRTLWIQTGGTSVRIADPASTRTMIVVPDVVDSAQLEFRLLAEDNQGRVNSAGTSVVVVPQPVYARVIGSVVNENDGVAVFRVRLNTPATEAVTLVYRTLAGTALVEADFLPVQGILTFAAGEQEMEISIPLSDDDEIEELKMFSLQISTLGESPFSNSGVAVIRNGVEPELDQVIGFVDAGPVTIVEGEIYTNPLDGTLTPQGQGKIFYTSYNPAVASVDANGLVAGLSPGTTTIEVRRTADDTYREAINFYDINVLASNLTAQIIQFEVSDSLEIPVNGTISNPIVNNGELAPGSGVITYSSDNEAVAVVDANGNVLAVGEGSATITAVKASDTLYASAAASYQVVVGSGLLPQSISFQNAGPLSLLVNDSAVSNVIVEDPEQAPGSGAISYVSSDPNVATVGADGSVTPLAAGSVTITATKAADERYAEATASYELTVSLLQQSVSIDEDLLVLALGQTGSISMVGDAIGGTGAITYESSNPAIAEVDANGLVTANSSGTGSAVITAMIAGDAMYEPTSVSYTVLVDGPMPVFQQAYIKASNTESEDGFGGSNEANLGLDLDGDLLIVGAIGEDSGGGVNGDATINNNIDSGAAYIYRRVNGQWQHEAYLKSSGPKPGDGFGWDVAIEGDVAAVSAPILESGRGAVYIFRANGSSWGLEQQLALPEDRLGFGSSIALSGDTIAISTLSGNSISSVYIYRFSGASWESEGALNADNQELDDGFGLSIDLDGNTLVVGAPFEDSAATGVNGDGSNNSAAESGAAYVFQRTNGVWSQQAYLKGISSISRNEFGADVAVEGDRVAIGYAQPISVATVFTRTNGTWSGGQTFFESGDVVSLNNDWLILGDRVRSSAAVYQWDSIAAQYIFEGTIVGNNTESTDNFASTIAVSGDLVAVGAPTEASPGLLVNGPEGNGAPGAGAAYIFCLDPATNCAQ